VRAGECGLSAESECISANIANRVIFFEKYRNYVSMLFLIKSNYEIDSYKKLNKRDSLFYNNEENNINNYANYHSIKQIAKCE